MKKYFRDVNLVLERKSYPSELNKDGSSQVKKGEFFSKYVTEHTGVKVAKNSYTDTTNGVAVKASLGNITEEQKMIDFITMVEENLNDDGIHISLDGFITAHYEHNGTQVTLEEIKKQLDWETTVEEAKHSQERLDITEEDVKDDIIIYISESRKSIEIDNMDETVEEYFETEADIIEEDDWDESTDISNEKVVKKKIIRGGKVLFKKKTNREGYKFINGREVRMSSKEIRDRRRAQKKASRKRKVTVKKSQHQRKKSLGARSRRIGR